MVGKGGCRMDGGRSGAIVFLCSALACTSAVAAVTFVSPASGDTLFLGDTVTVRYAWETPYPGAGVNIYMSPDTGGHWFLICPLETSPFCTVLPEDSLFWGHVHFIMPDTLRSANYRDAGGALLPFPTDGRCITLGLWDYVDPTMKFNYPWQFPAARRTLGVKSSNTHARARAAATGEAGDRAEDGDCGAGVGLALLVPLALGRHRRKRPMPTRPGMGTVPSTMSAL